MGVEEFAPRKPPPLVPKCFMISSAATGPEAITCLAPSSVSTTMFPDRFWGTPCHTSSRPPIMDSGSSTRVMIRIKSL